MKNHESPYIIRFSEMGIEDVPKVGGKNASLGEMIRHLKPCGVKIPDGFATTADAYRSFIKANNLEERIRQYLDEYQNGKIDLDEAGRSIRQLFLKSTFPTPLAESIRKAYMHLSEKFIDKSTKIASEPCLDVAVRSSATAEDLPQASFAGQQETYLNVSGIDSLMTACRNCYASLFTNRAIVYREKMGFDHMKVALSIGVQKMVRADKTCSGVMFTVDTETGFPNALIINGSWGLGENIVKGTVNPDQFYVFKPHADKAGLKPILEKVMGSKEIKMIYTTDEGSSTENVPTNILERQSFVLNDEEILQLARWEVAIEKHYGKAMDIEWVKDDLTNELYIVQARPETVHSIHQNGIFKSYSLVEKAPQVLMTGLSIGNTIVSGKVKIVRDTTDLKQYFIGQLASGISKIAASQYPKPVIVRTSDFKTNEYAGLIGGKQFEPHEENPMLGWRGASRYYSDGYREGFELECRALKKVRDEIGLDNVIVMIPFCRTLTEAEIVLNVMQEFGLKRG